MIICSMPTDVNNAAAVRTGEMMALLSKQERSKARELWEEVFDEDTEQFLNYYDAYVADHNYILGDWEQEELVSMVQLNPYKLWMGDAQIFSYYIVAVATRESCRHQGRMRKLLTEACDQMYREKIPFTFLMPASEEIYRPFDFVTVYRQSMISYGTQTEKDEEGWICVPCQETQIEELVNWSNSFLKKNSDISTVRSEDYYRRIWQEQEAMNGEILLFYEKDVMKGYCFTGCEGNMEAWEIAVDGENTDLSNKKAVAALQKWCAKKNQFPLRICGFLPGSRIEGTPEKELSYRPMTMVRIIHLEEFVKHLRAEECVVFDLEIEDPMIQKNCGCFRFQIGPDGGTMCLLKDAAAPKMTINRLTACFFGVQKADEILQDKIRLPGKIYLNELV